jgi:N6-adenosine-specific RNA methylase IME4
MPTHTNGHQLVQLSKATQMLAEAKTLNEVKKILDIAEAARVYARAAKLGLEAYNHAAEVKVRAERKAGEMLAQLERRPGRRTDRPPDRLSGGSEYREVLVENGIQERSAERWQQLASLPDREFEQQIEETRGERPITTTGLVHAIKEERREARREENREKVAAVKSPAEIVGRAQFATIVIDPPWDWGDEGDVDQMGRAKPTYHTMPFEKLKDLPVGKLADTDCHLYLWITNRSLPKGFALIDSWGFRYVTCLTWVKPHFGMGNYFRGQTEHVLFAVKGSQSLKRKDAGTVFHAPRGKEHSSKPNEFYELAESCSPGPYLEMFGRHKRKRWTIWGEDSA